MKITETLPIGQKGCVFHRHPRHRRGRGARNPAPARLRRTAQPGIYEVVAEDVLTGESGAKLWSEALGRPIKYIGDDIDQWVQSLRAFVPNWMAYDFKYMMKHFQEDGPVSSAAGLERLRQRLGRDPRSYHDFAVESAKLWSEASK